jgi:internalin A
MMKFIGVQKHMNLPRLIIVALNAILLLLGNALYSEIATAQRENSRLTFADWCRQKDSLSPEAKHTVEVLLEEAGTTECDAANQKLSSLTRLALYNNQISDIKPLQSLTNLTRLDLVGTQISDIKPLASLTNLTDLDLRFNKISDIKPLAS